MPFIAAFTPESICEDLTNLIREQIQPWMKSCCERQEGHSHCDPSNNTKVLPKRLVHILEAEHEYIKLVEIDHSTDIASRPYLILSYCWGQGNESAKTTIRNLESRLEKVSTITLPRTIQDAIRLTRMMGFEYLWVDAMCILQATESHPGDFETEAIKMRDYYANAQCCISASLASDSSEGFLTERPLGRFPISAVLLKLSNPSQSLYLEVDESERNLSDILYETPLMERGWYVQEYMLSRRVLHWTFHGLFLQCQSSTFLEGSFERWTCYQYDHFRDLRAILSLRDDRIITFDGWYLLLESVSQKALTYERDRMYAIHGVASLLIQRLQAEYFLGVFRPTIAQGLAWSHNAFDHDDFDFVQVKPRSLMRPVVPVGKQFPTWCWASSCPIRYHEIDETNIFILDDHPRRPQRFPTHPGHISLEEASDSKLYIKAPLIRIGLLRRTWYAPETFDIAIQDKSKERLIALGGTRHLDCKEQSHGPIFSRYRSIAAEWEPRIDVQVVLIAQLSTKESRWPCYLGLLVQETGDIKEKTYKRYGTLEIRWMLHAPERYTSSIADCYESLEEIVLE